MAEKPILFSGSMVRALLDGVKTQTRRVVKHNPFHGEPDWERAWVDGKKSRLCDGGAEYLHVPMSGGEFGEATTQRCWPSYFKADLLWVRETWRPWSWREDNPIRIQYQADGSTGECDVDDEEWYERIAIGATHECEAAGLPKDEDGAYYWTGTGRDCPLRWRPSIFLPRAGSRITLEVVDVRAQRVQEISEDDARAEGVDLIPEAPAALNHRTAFAGLWNSINAERGFGWAANPWVFAYTFKAVPNA